LNLKTYFIISNKKMSNNSERFSHWVLEDDGDDIQERGLVNKSNEDGWRRVNTQGVYNYSNFIEEPSYSATSQQTSSYSEQGPSYSATLHQGQQGPSYSATLHQGQQGPSYSQQSPSYSATLHQGQQGPSYSAASNNRSAVSVRQGVNNDYISNGWCPNPRISWGESNNIEVSRCNVGEEVGSIVSNIKDKYIDGSYNGSLETIVENGFEGRFLRLRDIYRYITLGRMISDSYYDELEKHVEECIKDNGLEKVNSIMVNDWTIGGVMYKKRELCIPYIYYGVVGKGCLEWALCNPEK
jgi:hypothetical protein